jgi:hypothetical protein
MKNLQRTLNLAPISPLAKTQTRLTVKAYVGLPRVLHHG